MLELQPVQGEGLNELVESLLAARPDVRLSHYLAERTRGNALLVRCAILMPSAPGTHFSRPGRTGWARSRHRLSVRWDGSAAMRLRTSLPVGPPSGQWMRRFGCKRVAATARSQGIALNKWGTDPAAAGPLTEVERRPVTLLGDGLSNRQIADILSYSTQTIEAYLTRLYKKTGYNSRVELIVANVRGDLSTA